MLYWLEFAEIGWARTCKRFALDEPQSRHIIATISSGRKTFFVPSPHVMLSRLLLEFAPKLWFLWCDWWWCWGQGGVHDSDIKDSPALHTHGTAECCTAASYTVAQTLQCRIFHCSVVYRTAHCAHYAVQSRILLCHILHCTLHSTQRTKLCFRQCRILH